MSFPQKNPPTFFVLINDPSIYLFFLYVILAFSQSPKNIFVRIIVLMQLLLIFWLFLAGKPANIVDANMSVLRGRIQQVRKREKLVHTCGWNYKQNYDPKYKRDSMVSESAEIMGLACGAIGFVLLIGSLSICLVSLLVYICMWYIPTINILMSFLVCLDLRVESPECLENL